MKKKLIVLSFLVGGLSLWGMKHKEVDPESRMKFMQALEEPEFKAKLNLNLFMQFHDKVFEYFKADQTEKNRTDTLGWIKDWLPMMNLDFKSQDELETIKAFVDNPEEILEHLDRAAVFFVEIYTIYLRNNSEQLCIVLFTYFNMDLMENQYYQGFLKIMLAFLGWVADIVLSAPKKEGALVSESWKDVIDSIQESMEKYPKNKKLFSLHYKSIQQICVNVQNELQGGKKPMPVEQKEAPIPFAQETPALSLSEEEVFFSPEPEEFLGITTRKAFLDVLKEKKKTKNELENSNKVEIQQPLSQELPAETRPEKTTMEKVGDWFWWLDGAIRSLFWRMMG